MSDLILALLGDAVMLGDAVLREVRPLARLPLALANVRAVLPIDRWMVQFLHGPRNTDAVRAEPSLARAVAAGTLLLRRYEMDGVLVDETLDRHAHFNYQKRAAFWRSFTRPLLLLFEPDTVLCPQPRRSLDAFAGYAFTGAPWAPYADGANPAWCYNLQHCVGNSGLSLWRRDATLKARPILLLPSRWLIGRGWAWGCHGAACRCHSPVDAAWRRPLGRTNDKPTE